MKTNISEKIKKIYLCAIMSKSTDELFKNVISHAKEYGFVFPSSEIYDGLSAVYDYGQNGAELKNNIKTYWWKSMVQLNDNIVGIDSAIFIGDKQLDTLINLKSKEQLIGEIIGLLQSPAKNVISALQSGGNKLAGIVKTLQERG